MKCLYCLKERQQDHHLVDIFLWRKLPAGELCHSCQKQFSRLTNQQVCYGCSCLSEQKYCEDCKRWKTLYPQYDFHHQALYHYNQAMQEWFQQFKFKGDYYLAATFSKELKKILKQYSNYLIVPIPLSPKRQELRGFNQVESLLEFANTAFKQLLLKKEEREEQSHHNRMDRLKTSQPFVLNQKAVGRISQPSILIVDDVYTTGRTIFHAADLLSELKPKIIRSISLAR